MYEDKTLTCRDCGNEFVFSASEQEFFAQKGFQNEPTRCPACRAARRAQNGNGGAPRQMFTVICDGCGCETQVPFQPRGDRPVYCRVLKKHRDMISREKDTVRANYDDVVESTGFVVSSPLARFHLRLMNPVISKKKTLCIAWGSCGRPP